MKRMQLFIAIGLSTGMLALAQAAWADGARHVPVVQAPGNPVAGATVFHQTCVVCHASNGRGTMPGMPDFTRTDGVLTLPTAELESRIMHGFSDGKAPMAMPAKGDNPNLSPHDIRDVIAYMRNTFWR
jgi:mono/diheme cytochrome c family protein